MKKHTNLFFIFLILFTFISNAQLKDVYQKGWIVKNDDTKVEGYIKLEDLTKTSSRICFKKNTEDKDFEFYKTSQLKSFKRRENENFRLLNIKINNNTDEVSVFGNLILQGKISIYKTVYDTKIMYVLERDQQYFVLQNDEIIEDQGKYRRFNYQGILNLATELQFSSGETNVDFYESSFIRIIKKYNAKNNSESKEFKIFKEKKRYFVADGGLVNDFNQFYGQVTYRTFFPEIVDNISLNVGLSYMNLISIESYSLREVTNTKKHNRSIFSIPLVIQKSFFNDEIINPYLFVGATLNYLKLDREDGLNLLKNGSDNSTGVGFIYGLGIDVDIYQNIFLKFEYKYFSAFFETKKNEGYVNNLFLFGVGYHFGK